MHHINIGKKLGLRNKKQPEGIPSLFCVAFITESI